MAMRIPLSCLFFLCAALVNAQQPAPQPGAEVRMGGKGSAGLRIEPIAADVKFLEEKSLLFQGNAMGGSPQETLPGGQAEPFNQDASNGNLPIGPRMSDMREDTPNAYRCYGFTLAPGERLKLKLKSEDHGKILMRFLPKSVADAMSAQVRRANNAAAPFRASRMEIANVTEGPYVVALMLYGQANYAYRLEIERIAKR